MKMIGLIPAAGQATRLGKLPCSKEVLPIYPKAIANQPSKVLSSHLLEAYKLADIENIYFILRKGKWDIPQYFGNGAHLNVHLGYLIMQHPYGVPFTLNEAYPFIKNEKVAMGFPDIIFAPKNAYCVLRSKMKITKSEVILGLFPVQNKEKWDLVDVDSNGKIIDIVIKQNHTDLKFAWAIAIWTPEFTEYLHQFVEKALVNGGKGRIKTNNSSAEELYLGDIILSALKDGLKVESAIFEKGTCIDLGTPNDLIGYLNSAAQNL